LQPSQNRSLQEKHRKSKSVTFRLQPGLPQRSPEDEVPWFSSLMLDQKPALVPPVFVFDGEPDAELFALTGAVTARRPNTDWTYGVWKNGTELFSPAANQEAKCLAACSVLMPSISCIEIARRNESYRALLTLEKLANFLRCSVGSVEPVFFPFFIS